jgi:DNA-binding NarL/FixJ family response regulator
MEVEQGQPLKQQPKQQHLEWRRNRVLELTSQGRTEREVAQILSIGNGTVHRDLAYLNKTDYPECIANVKIKGTKGNH